MDLPASALVIDEHAQDRELTDVSIDVSAIPVGARWSAVFRIEASANGARLRFSDRLDVEYSHPETALFAARNAAIQRLFLMGHYEPRHWPELSGD